MADSRTISQLDREASKHAVGRLVIQFRIERASRRVGQVAIMIFVVALIAMGSWSAFRLRDMSSFAQLIISDNYNSIVAGDRHSCRRREER